MKRKVIIVLGVLTAIIIISTARANLTNLGYSEKTETIWKVFLGLTIFVAFALCWISGIIILIENNKILLVESINQRKLDIPGGGIKKGEIYSETLKREFCEETGFIVEPVRILGIVESCFYYKEKEKVFHNIRIHYLTKKTGGEIKAQRNGTDTFGAGWYDIDDLKKGKYSGSILEVAEEALENFVFKKKEEIIRR